MRRKPDAKELKEAFIKNSPVDDETGATRHNADRSHQSYGKWPFGEIDDTPIFEEGSNLRKPINLQLKEFEWNTIDRHVKSLGVGKNEWFRYAVYKLLLSEQREILKKK